MSTTSTSSSVQAARQIIADRLREMCWAAGLDGKTLAALCGWHPSKVSRISSVKTAPSADDIRVWCRACGCEDQADDLIASLRAVEGMWVQWRRMERTGLRRAQEAQLPLFERTQRFRCYSSWMVPGLIQTRDYTASVLRAVHQRRGVVDDVDDAVQVRMERQAVLHEGGQFAFLMEETVLRNSLGGVDVQRDQLRRLLTLGSLPQISLGVIPEQRDRSRMPVEGFWIFDAAQVNVELVSGYLTLTQPTEVGMYAETFAQLAGMAVYGVHARELISSALESLG
ncbi:helix-turn-helix domain-containing protein [Streptomyces sp. H34-S4]|uniref:helix-turn-helix domain-containing protein n=1 Tax=Streptomyces sp. H34-S4 TaxID=2996463 RepID=UPI002270D131|nr:helix-turn-helix transcriptional regulator [Streptomyces sp. H34-S4]MCY0937781.1 helix-turn-helix transcriptional regulator [Streptomyces sp. H34-S4]